MANTCIPLYDDGDELTAIVGSGGVTGKTFVDISAALNPATGAPVTVVTATAAGLSLGVAVYDAAAGGIVGVLASKGLVLPVTAGGTIAAGAEVEVGSGGKAVTIASGKARGRALSAGTSNNDVFIQLY